MVGNRSVFKTAHLHPSEFLVYLSQYAGGGDCGASNMLHLLYGSTCKRFDEMGCTQPWEWMQGWPLPSRTRSDCAFSSAQFGLIACAFCTSLLVIQSRLAALLMYSCSAFWTCICLGRKHLDILPSADENTFVRLCILWFISRAFEWWIDIDMHSLNQQTSFDIVLPNLLSHLVIVAEDLFACIAG